MCPRPAGSTRTSTPFSFTALFRSRELIVHRTLPWGSGSEGVAQADERRADQPAVETVLVKGVDRRRCVAGQVAPQAPRIGGRKACRLDIGGAQRSIVEIIDEARQAEGRIGVEFAARGPEQIIDLVL